MNNFIKLTLATIFGVIVLGFKFVNHTLPPAKPDLIVDSIRTNWVEDFLVVKVRIKNIGTAKAGSFNNYIELSPSKSKKRIQERRIVGLLVNQTKEIEFRYNAIIVPTPNANVNVIADSKIERITELLEDNNSLTRSVAPHP